MKHLLFIFTFTLIILNIMHTKQRRTKYRTLLYMNHNPIDNSHTFKLHWGITNTVTTSSFSDFIVGIDDAVVNDVVTSTGFYDDTLVSAAWYKIYSSFLINLDLTSYNNYKHYVLYDVDFNCNTSTQPVIDFKIIYFDCAEKADQYYKSLKRSETFSVKPRYRYSTTQGIIAKTNVGSSTDIEDLLKGNGLLLSCTN